MSKVVKPIVYGCILTISLGIIGYLAVVFYHILILGVDDSRLLVDIIRSKKMMYYSMPYTLIVQVLSTVLVVRKLQTNHIVISIAIMLITAVSITLGPLKIISIHMNYLPIILGGLIGAFVGKKLKQPLQRASQ